MSGEKQPSRYVWTFVGGRAAILRVSPGATEAKRICEILVEGVPGYSHDLDWIVAACNEKNERERGS